MENCFAAEPHRVFPPSTLFVPVSGAPAERMPRLCFWAARPWTFPKPRGSSAGISHGARPGRAAGPRLAPQDVAGLGAAPGWARHHGPGGGARPAQKAKWARRGRAAKLGLNNQRGRDTQGEGGPGRRCCRTIRHLRQGAHPSKRNGVPGIEGGLPFVPRGLGPPQLAATDCLASRCAPATWSTCRSSRRRGAACRATSLASSTSRGRWAATPTSPARRPAGSGVLLCGAMLCKAQGGSTRADRKAQRASRPRHAKAGRHVGRADMKALFWLRVHAMPRPGSGTIFFGSLVGRAGSSSLAGVGRRSIARTLRRARLCRNVPPCGGRGFLRRRVALWVPRGR